MTNLLPLYIFTILLYLVYNYTLFGYVTNILLQAKRGGVVHALLSLLNLMLLGVFVALQQPIYLVYVTIFIAFSLEFKLMSKAPWRQAVLLGALFAMHVSAIHLPVSIALCKAFNISTISIYTNSGIRVLSIAITTIVLFLFLFAIMKFLPTEGVKKLSVSRRYPQLISALSLASIVYTTFSSILLYSQRDYPEQLYISLLAFVLNIVLFYFTFVYCVNFVNMTINKHYRDEVQTKYEQLLIRKVEVIKNFECDSLTGAYNKMFMHSMLRELYNDKSQSFGILFIDINALKAVNDTFGHNVGDELIKDMVACVKRAIRDIDVLGRVGGDELLVILNSNSKEELELVADRINRIIELDAVEKHYRFSASIGKQFIDYGRRYHSLEQVLDLADADMRKQKAAYYKRGVA